MTSFSANPAKSANLSTRRVVIVIYPGVTLLDVAGPAQVFTTANDANPDVAAPYEVVLASTEGGEIASDTGVTLGSIPIRLAAGNPIDTLLVAGGNGVLDAVTDDKLVRWIRRHAPGTRRTGSTCTGAFLTAQAGLLSGRRTATHWRWCDMLRQRYPDVAVESDPIFVRDGAHWSSAGVTAGIDLALAMVEEDCGREVAFYVACALVVYLKRPGGQSQFSAALTAQIADRTATFSGLHAWISDNLDDDLRVERLAERAGMSPRTFARTYVARMGLTPAKTVEKMRVDAARRLLEEEDWPIATVATKCGFGDKERMRRAFRRHLGTAPSSYRNRFGRMAAE